MSNFVKQLLIILTLSWCWFLFSSANIFPALLFPSPQEIIKSFYIIFAEDNISHDILLTIVRMISGLVMGIVLGIVSGVLIGFSSLTKQITFWVDFLRSIPGAALFPAFMLLFGLGELAKIFLVIFATVLIVIINTTYGIKNMNKTRLMVAQTLKLNKLQTFFQIILPESLPYISVGIRHAISYSLIMVVVAEMFMGTEYGLGKRIVDFHLTYEIGKMYSVIILTGMIGYLANQLYIYFESKKIHWIGK
ncbi:MAG: ABC transporter permease [Candidatus Magasanikbacteria bacterium]|jgi:NitT/TauT family transport system permease protein